jgi:hypothetical protein
MSGDGGDGSSNAPVFDFSLQQLLNGRELLGRESHFARRGTLHC